MAAEKEFLVVSGSAKGVDEAAMLGALKAQGTAILVCSPTDCMKGALQFAKYHSHLMNDDLALIHRLS